MPIRELAQVVDDAWGIGAEVVGTVLMDAHTGRVFMVVSIAAKVVALFHNQAGLALLRGQSFRDGQPSKSCPDNQAINMR